MARPSVGFGAGEKDGHTAWNRSTEGVCKSSAFSVLRGKKSEADDGPPGCRWVVRGCCRRGRRRSGLRPSPGAATPWCRARSLAGTAMARRTRRWLLRGACSIGKSDCGQRLRQVFHQVTNVLDANRDAHQSVADPGPLAFVGRQQTVRGLAGHADQAFHAAQAQGG